MIGDRVLRAHQVGDLIIEVALNINSGLHYVRIRHGTRLYYSEPVENEREGIKMAGAMRTGMGVLMQVLEAGMMEGWRKGAKP